jgi:hypothetical protein
MPLYAELTQEDKALLDTLVAQLRAQSGIINQYLSRAQVISDLFASGGNTVLSSLTAGAVVPNSSNLAGAQSLTKEEIVEILGDINNALSVYATPAKRALQVKAAGVNAIS